MVRGVVVRDGAGTGVVWAAPTAQVLAAWPHAESWLTEAERGRAARFLRGGDRDDFVAAHALVRLCAGELAKAPATELTVTQLCADCGGPHGQPTIAERPDIHVSLAHTRGHVVAGADWARIGVDVERIRGSGAEQALIESVLAPAEAERVRAANEPAVAFVALWVLKESLVKIGELSLDRLAEVDLSGTGLVGPEPSPALGGPAAPNLDGSPNLGGFPAPGGLSGPGGSPALGGAPTWGGSPNPGGLSGPGGFPNPGGAPTSGDSPNPGRARWGGLHLGIRRDDEVMIGWAVATGG